MSLFKAINPVAPKRGGIKDALADLTSLTNQIQNKQRTELNDNMAIDQALIKKQTDASGEEFKKLAEQQLGDMTQFNQSQRAQEQLARKEAMSANQGVQRALMGRLASQGVRGGAAAAAQMGAINQGAQMQAQIGQQMIAQRADKEQELRQQLLSAILAGKQFGNAQIKELLANRANIEAARLARK